MAEEVDEWLKEFEEALRLTEETTGDIQEQHSGNSNNIDGMLTNSDKLMQPVSVSSARRKLTQLSKRIERLESLLQDPDIKATMYDITAFLSSHFFSPPHVFEAPPAFIFLLYTCGSLLENSKWSHDI
jgi:hypothetical protein